MGGGGEDGGRGGKFLVLKTSIIHFTLRFIFITVWLIEDLLFEIRHLDKLQKLYDTSTIHKMLKSCRSMMGIRHMRSLKTMCPPGYVGSRSTQDTDIYIIHLHLHIHPYHTKCPDLVETR